ncbi:DUF433 domain-containing protein [Salinarimonas sp. NSM]|uniref:DUF433 domain-containing protein n=1 Tax=Salinarimonas sp. NSM TaxID=3458003 RepID=UPI004036629F
MNDRSSVVFAFTADEVARLTGLSTARLRDWDRAGFFQPRHVRAERGRPHARLYSFKDVVGLRVLKLLRSEYKVSLAHLRDVARELLQHSAEPWAEIKLYVLNRRVYFDEPETGKARGVIDGQYVLLPLEDVESEIREKVSVLRRRDERMIGRVEKRRNVVRNAPVIAGTRIPVSAVRHFSQAGYSIEDILEEYPTLTRADVEAALAYADGAAA